MHEPYEPYQNRRRKDAKRAALRVGAILLAFVVLVILVRYFTR
jgi:hypothetical protein